MKPLSLKMRAIALLSQREHSRTELRRKLQRIQRSEAAKTSGRGQGKCDACDDEGEGAGAAVDAVDAASELDALLDWLQAQDYLSEARFVESRIHTRAPRYGSLRIKQELAQHGLSLNTDAMAALKAQEFEHAKAVWLRKFGGQRPDNAMLRAKQIRFLIARGFASETIRNLLRDDDE